MSERAGDGGALPVPASSAEPTGRRPLGAAAGLLGLALAALAAAPALAGDAEAGREKAGQCKTCHGIDGLANIPEAPHIAGENAVYIENQLEAFRSGKRTHPIMSVIAQGLSDADIADLAAWYASIEISVTVPE